MQTTFIQNVFIMLQFHRGAYLVFVFVQPGYWIITDQLFCANDDIVFIRSNTKDHINIPEYIGYKVH